MSPFLKTIKPLFATIPSTLFAKQSESFYHALFLVILESMGIKVQAELPTNMGQIDLAVEMHSCIYIIELTFNKDSANALKQIERKDYKQKYTIEEKYLILLGINFSTEERNISDCRAVTYHKDGSMGEEGPVSV